MKTVYSIIQGSTMEHPDKWAVLKLRFNKSLKYESEFIYLHVTRYPSQIMEVLTNCGTDVRNVFFEFLFIITS